MDMGRASLADEGYRAARRAMVVATSPVLLAFHTALGRGRVRPDLSQRESLNRRFERLLDADLDNVAAGYYARSALFDLPLGEYVLRGLELGADVPRILRRGWAARSDELPAHVERKHYPRYYLRTFHWQTDGWLSRHSARVYDVGVELLFGGTADVMRRSIVPPVVDAVRGLERPRVLDIGTGTGRALKLLSRSLPAARLYGVDLSAPYLEEARRVLGDVFDVNLLRENAEELPFADGSFDAATSVFLFHELPRDARRRVLAEAHRVLRPGGHLILLDAAQALDGADILSFLEAFWQLYHEPYFRSYLRDPLDHALEEAGFEVMRSDDAFLARRLVALKRG